MRSHILRKVEILLWELEKVIKILLVVLFVYFVVMFSSNLMRCYEHTIMRSCHFASPQKGSWTEAVGRVSVNKQTNMGVVGGVTYNLGPFPWGSTTLISMFDLRLV